MKTDKNDPEEKRKMMFQEKERMVIAQMFLNRNKEMGSSTRTSYGFDWIMDSSCSLLYKGKTIYMQVIWYPHVGLEK